MEIICKQKVTNALFYGKVTLVSVYENRSVLYDVFPYVQLKRFTYMAI